MEEVSSVSSLYTLQILFIQMMLFFVENRYISIPSCSPG